MQVLRTIDRRSFARFYTVWAKSGLLALPQNSNLSGCSTPKPDIWRKLLTGGRENLGQLNHVPKRITCADHEVLSFPTSFPERLLPQLSITSES